MIEKQNDLKEVIVHLRTPTGAPAGPRDLSGIYTPPHCPSSLLPSLPLWCAGKAVSSGLIPTSVPEEVQVPRMPDGEKGCESCLATTATRWYQWGPAHEHCRLCNFCYTYWRKYGGLKLPTRWGESLSLPSLTL